MNVDNDQFTMEERPPFDLQAAPQYTIKPVSRTNPSSTNLRRQARFADRHCHVE